MEKHSLTSPLILASGSPRRKELLSLLGIPFTILCTNTPEKVTKTDPAGIVEELSLQKACAAAEQISEGCVLGADTVVAADQEVLGKPADPEDARRMLRKLSGRGHEVYTGVTLLKKEGEKQTVRTFHCRTVVHVHAMSEEEIEDYIRTGDPFDKAGSYGIQGPFAAFVDGIEGDYQNVVGLPVSLVYRELKKIL